LHGSRVQSTTTRGMLRRVGRVPITVAIAVNVATVPIAVGVLKGAAAIVGRAATTTDRAAKVAGRVKAGADVRKAAAVVAGSSMGPAANSAPRRPRRGRVLLAANARRRST